MGWIGKLSHIFEGTAKTALPSFANIGFTYTILSLHLLLSFNNVLKPQETIVARTGGFSFQAGK